MGQAGEGVFVRYALFALLAVAANLAAQRVVLAALPSPGGLAPAIAAGTLVGLVVKYVLDRRFVFVAPRDRVRPAAGEFARYAATGVATTAIFWGAEVAAVAVFGNEAAREAGAVAGLAAGYAAKYRLDRQYVFAAGARA